VWTVADNAGLAMDIDQWSRPVKKLIKIKDVLACVPVSRAQIYAMIAEGKFPRQVKLGGFGAFWVEEEVEAWIQSHIDADRGVNPSEGSQPGYESLEAA
jgi:prophage regulatory protein